MPVVVVVEVRRDDGGGRRRVPVVVPRSRLSLPQPPCRRRCRCCLPRLLHQAVVVPVQEPLLPNHLLRPKRRFRRGPVKGGGKAAGGSRCCCCSLLLLLLLLMMLLLLLLLSGKGSGWRRECRHALLLMLQLLMLLLLLLRLKLLEEVAGAGKGVQRRGDGGCGRLVVPASPVQGHLRGHLLLLLTSAARYNDPGGVVQ